MSNKKIVSLCLSMALVFATFVGIPITASAGPIGLSDWEDPASGVILHMESGIPSGFYMNVEVIDDPALDWIYRQYNIDTSENLQWNDNDVWVQLTNDAGPNVYVYDEDWDWVNEHSNDLWYSDTYYLCVGELPRLTFNPNGGYGDEFTIRINEAYTIDILPDSPGHPNNYTFTGWYTEPVGGERVVERQTTVNPGDTVYAQWRSNSSTSSSGGGSRSGSGGGGGSNTPDGNKTTTSTTNTTTSAPTTVTASTISAISRGTGEVTVQAAAWTQLAGSTFQHDTVVSGAVQVRIAISNPAAITSDLKVSGYTTGTEVQRTGAIFNKYFSNATSVMHFDQTGSWGQEIRVAAKLDLSGMNTDNLVFYAYDRTAHSYQRIPNPRYTIDTNGYLHFSTERAGDIIVSDGPLVQ